MRRVIVRSVIQYCFAAESRIECTHKDLKCNRLCLVLYSSTEECSTIGNKRASEKVRWQHPESVVLLLFTLFFGRVDLWPSLRSTHRATSSPTLLPADLGPHKTIELGVSSQLCVSWCFSLTWHIMLNLSLRNERFYRFRDSTLCPTIFC